MPAPQNSVPEVLTESAKQGLSDLVTDYVSAGLSDLAYATTDLPGFLADTGPIVAAAQPTRQIVRAACRSYARGGGPQNLPGFDAVWGGICTPYLDSIGETPEVGSGVDVPFQGGQCPGVNYQISWSWSAGSFNSGPQSAQRVGPLTFSRAGTGSLACGGGQTYNVYRIIDGTGNSPLSLATGCGANVNTLSVTPIGSTANCGNPPPLYDPPKIKTGLPSLPSTPVDIPGVGPTPVNVTFNPDGTINVSLPDVGVDVDVPVDFGGFGDGGGGEPGGPGGGPPPGDVGNPGSPVSVGPGGEEEGEAPAGSVLTGLRVQIVAFPPSRNKYTAQVFRGAYYAYMGVPGLLDLDFGGAMVRSDQFLLAEKDNLTSWRVSANTGYELITTPYYREVEV